MRVQVKRIYDEPSASDGFRVLADRLWPRGIAKETARIDLWAKDAAPSTALRKAFAHTPERFAEFRAAYTAELRARPEALDALLAAARAARKRTVTLLYASRDTEHNHALVLAEALRSHPHA